MPGVKRFFFSLSFFLWTSFVFLVYSVRSSLFNDDWRGSKRYIIRCQFFFVLNCHRKYYWCYEALKPNVRWKSDDKMVKGIFFLSLSRSASIWAGWHFDDEEKRSSSATITRLFISRRFSFSLTTYDPLHKDFNSSDR